MDGRTDGSRATAQPQPPPFAASLPADRGGASGQVPTGARREAGLSVTQPSVTQSPATLEKANLDEPSPRNKTKNAQKTSERRVAPAFSYKDLIQLS